MFMFFQHRFNGENLKEKKQLSLRILFAVLFCSSILTLFTSMVQLYFDYKNGLKTIHDNIQFIQKSYLPSIIFDVYTLNEKQVESLLKGCLNFPDIGYLEIRDTSDKLYKCAGAPSTSKDIVYSFPLDYELPSGKIFPVGTLTLHADFKELYCRLWEKAYIILFSNMIKTFFAAILILMIINHIVVRHLIRISKFTRNLNLDKLCRKLTLNRKTSKKNESDELGQLVQSINGMIDNIRTDADKIKKIQSSLEEREKYFKSIFNTAENIAFVITDLGGKDAKILDVSPGAEKIFQYKRDEVIGQKAAIFHPSEIVEKFPNMQAALSNNNTGYSGETVLIRKSGECFPALLTIYPKFDKNGNLDGTIGVSIDITKRKEEEEKYKKTIESSIDGFWMVDRTGNFLEVNEAYSRMIGYSREELLKMSIMDIEAIESLGEIEKRIEKVVRNGSDRFESRHRHRNGHVIDVEVSATYTQDSGGLFFVFLRDITDRNQMERRLRQAQKMESIGTLASGISHDFNNLLFPILGSSEMLLEDLPEDSPAYENAREIFSAGKRAENLVKQILAFSRQSKHEMTPVRLQTILKEVVKLIRSTIPTNIKIHDNIQKDCGLVMADPTQIHQIAMNLITNAFHAVENKNGIIAIELKEIILKKKELPDSLLPPGKYTRLTVSDNGTGIKRSTINKIFEPYFTTKEKGKGTGLGLAVVYGIVKEHKGDIKVYSEEGKGTTFNIYIPLIEKFSQAATEDEPPRIETGTERILLVDDQMSVATLEAKMLTRLGYQVTKTTESPEALEIFKKNPENFDLVITDMTMPDMTGDQLAKALLSIKPELPIIICTGFSERTNKKQAETIGVKGFLLKPVTKSDMAQMVRNVLDDAKR